MRRQTSSLLLVGLLLALAPAWAADARPAEVWLERMAEAMRGTSYTGTFVYRYGNELETLRIVHRGSESGGRERLTSLNGVPREILRNGEKVTCILPDSRAVHVDWRQARNPLSELLPAASDDVSAGYRIELNGVGRVAGREAQRVRLQQRDGFRYGYELWIDRQSGLLLRSDLVDASGDAVEQIMFTEIEIRDHIPDRLLEPTLSGAGYTWFDPVEQTDDSGPADWQVTSLPPGFEPVMRERRPSADGSGFTEHHLFSDGLAAVSLYVEPLGEAAHVFSGRSSMGAVHAYGRTLDGHQIIVVGEVPAATVERIARSVRRNTGGSS
jgi:sigma-E factor negative regulatory protein RseB